MIKGIIILLLWSVNYVIVTTVINILLMGALHICFSWKCRKQAVVITKKNRIDMQEGNQCAGFSAAYVLRHWEIEKDGNRLYEAMSGKMSDGCVYPKGIRNLFSQEGFKVKYCAGNITALKNEVSQRNPVVVMIRTQTGQNGLHYVPVVGYDEQYIFMAESLGQFINCDSPYFNRKIAVREFKKLWNTSMLKMPLYRNTYIAVQYSK